MHVHNEAVQVSIETRPRLCISLRYCGCKIREPRHFNEYSAASALNVVRCIRGDSNLFRCRPTSIFLQARYVERNALRAKLVERAEGWRWSSIYRIARRDTKLADFLSPWPMERPQNWIECVNEPDKASELDDLRSSAQRGRPFGSENG